MISCPFEGVLCRQLERHTDGRGWLMELYRRDELVSENLPAMCYISMTKPGAVRGPHEHRMQSDLFYFAGPSMFRLYLWENRPNAAEFGKKWILECGENNKIGIIIPPGIVHAYKNIGEVEGIVLNAPNQLYAGSGRNEEIDEIRYEDSVGNAFVVD